MSITGKGRQELTGRRRCLQGFRLRTGIGGFGSVVVALSLGFAVSSFGAEVTCGVAVVVVDSRASLETGGT